MNASTVNRIVIPNGSIVSTIMADKVVFHVNSWFSENTDLADLLLSIANERLLKKRNVNDTNENMIYNAFEGNSHIDA